MPLRARSATSTKHETCALARRHGARHRVVMVRHIQLIEHRTMRMNMTDEALEGFEVAKSRRKTCYAMAVKPALPGPLKPFRVIQNIQRLSGLLLKPQAPQVQRFTRFDWTCKYGRMRATDSHASKRGPGCISFRSTEH